MKKYNYLEHTADIKFQAFGNSYAECFKNAAYALKNTISEDKIKPLIIKIIKISGKDYENLLYNFLEEFLFLIDTEDIILADIKNIRIEKNKNKLILTAVVHCGNIKEYKTITDIKAITYNDMFVKKDKNKYVCQVVLDV
jgi:SHS2 domain-containing protein